MIVIPKWRLRTSRNYATRLDWADLDCRMRQPSCKRGPRLGCINEASEAWRFFWGDTQPYPRPANAIDVPKTMRRDRSYLRYPTRRHQGSPAVLPQR